MERASLGETDLINSGSQPTALFTALGRALMILMILRSKIMGRWKRVAGLPLRQRQPTEDERLEEILETFKECGQKFLPEHIMQQYKNETGRLPAKRAVVDLLKRLT